MNKDIKDKWITALNSGEYKQGRFTLYDKKSNGFCCLGVLCDLMNIEHKDYEYLNLKSETIVVRNYGNEDDNSSNKLPDSAGRLIGLRQSEQNTLIGLNDFEAKSFKEIATYIEENL